MKIMYIIHATSKSAFEEIRAEKRLKSEECVFVLKGFESPSAHDTEEIKHIWEEKK